MHPPPSDTDVSSDVGSGFEMHSRQQVADKAAFQFIGELVLYTYARRNIHKPPKRHFPPASPIRNVFCIHFGSIHDGGSV